MSAMTYVGRRTNVGRKSDESRNYDDVSNDAGQSAEDWTKVQRNLDEVRRKKKEPADDVTAHAELRGDGGAVRPT
ncbi:unnamed protein product [Sphagnum jensenii]|uniref:Uncharacterized protein n=1 Tax=Sphagnum jensenii TaxID=128206 RepID=A0ABP1BMR3_9BRYO